MTARSVVKALDVLEHAGPCLVTRSVSLMVNQFGLERGKEPLHDRVVPAVPFSTHGAADTGVFEYSSIITGGILGALVGVHKQPLWRPPSHQRHGQCVAGELLSQAAVQARLVSSTDTQRSTSFTENARCCPFLLSSSVNTLRCSFTMIRYF